METLWQVLHNLVGKDIQIKTLQGEVIAGRLASVGEDVLKLEGPMSERFVPFHAILYVNSM